MLLYFSTAQGESFRVAKIQAFLHWQDRVKIVKNAGNSDWNFRGFMKRASKYSYNIFGSC